MTNDLTEYEIQILREANNEFPRRPWGAAVGAACEALYKKGYLNSGFGITDKGRALLAELESIKPDKAKMTCENVTFKNSEGIRITPSDFTDAMLNNKPTNPKDDLTEQLLQTRTTTHGSFETNAAVAQALKSILQSERNYALLPEVMKEALDFIFSKIGRIMSGQPMYDDHWHDISGYAMLIVRFIEENKDGN